MTQVITQEDAARAAAEKIKSLKDVTLPRLDLWNYDGVCLAHRQQGLEKPDPLCVYQECGGDLYGYQRVGVAWLYLRGRGLLADDPGIGKWIEALHLLCLLVQRGELSRRALFVVQTPSLPQCVDQTRRWAPELPFEYVSGKMSKTERTMRYASSHWKLLLVGSHIALRDRKVLESMTPYSLFFSDDVDELLNPSNATHRAIVALASKSERSISGNATSLQTKVEQLHAASLACGGHEVFGGPSQFTRKHVKLERVPIYVKGGVRRMTLQRTGYKNLPEFREKFLPMYLRRRLEDLEGVDIPTLLPPSTVWLEMSGPQQLLYDKLRSGALKLKSTQGNVYNAAQTAFQSGQRICAGVPALGGPDGPGMSPKLDWVMDKLTGVWSDRKIIAYMINRGMVEALTARARAAGIEPALVWGDQRDRLEHVQRFQRDPTCRLLIGSKSVERSLNLQVASIVVAVDTVLNPARIKQLIGRIRRASSAHKHVQLVSLLMAGTQEEGYLDVLRRRAALSDYVFSEDTGAEIFGSLSQFEMLEMILG